MRPSSKKKKVSSAKSAPDQALRESDSEAPGTGSKLAKERAVEEAESAADAWGLLQGRAPLTRTLEVKQDVSAQMSYGFEAGRSSLTLSRAFQWSDGADTR